MMLCSSNADERGCVTAGGWGFGNGGCGKQVSGDGGGGGGGGGWFGGGGGGGSCHGSGGGGGSGRVAPFDALLLAGDTLGGMGSGESIPGYIVVSQADCSAAGPSSPQGPTRSASSTTTAAGPCAAADSGGSWVMVAFVAAFIGAAVGILLFPAALAYAQRQGGASASLPGPVRLRNSACTRAAMLPNAKPSAAPRARACTAPRIRSL